MGDFLLGRLLYSVAAFTGVLVIAFTLLHLSGDPATLLVPMDATRDEVLRVREAYGLDRPLPLQFGQFVARLAHGDLGHSYRQGLPVAELIAERVGATLQLALAGLIVAVLVGVPVGVVAATRRGSLVDAGAMLLALVGLSVPSFWLGLLFIIV